MRRYTFVLIIIITLCFAVGCHTNSLNKDISKSDFNDNYVLEEELFENQSTDMNVKISYPQIKDSDSSLIKQINYIIKDNAIDQYYNKYNLKGLTLDQSYEIEMFSDEVLSVVFYGYSYVAGTPHPNNSCHAVTINLKTAEILLLSDFIKSYKDLEDKILDGNYEVLYGGLKTINTDEIIKLINGKLEQGDFYISKSENICILIDLPHGAGGYSIIQIK